MKGDESLFTKFDEPLHLDGSDSDLTELMIQSEMSQKDAPRGFPCGAFLRKKEPAPVRRGGQTVRG